LFPHFVLISLWTKNIKGGAAIIAPVMAKVLLAILSLPSNVLRLAALYPRLERSEKLVDWENDLGTKEIVKSVNPIINGWGQ